MSPPIRCPDCGTWHSTVEFGGQCPSCIIKITLKAGQTELRWPRRKRKPGPTTTDRGSIHPT